MKKFIVLFFTIILAVAFGATDRTLTTMNLLMFEPSSGGSDKVTLKAPALASSWAWTFPTTAGTSNYFLQTNGSGVTTWADALTPAGTQTVTNKTIQGSSNTISINDSNFILGPGPYIAFDNTGGSLNGTTTLAVPHTTGNSETITFFSSTDTVVGRATTDTLTNKTLTSPIISNGTASTVPYLDASKVLTSSAVTPTELGYLTGTTSAVQTQLDAKQARSTLTTKGDLYVATASATVARQAVGSDGQILTADSAQTNGIKWATPASAPSAASEISNLTLTTSVAANALTIAVKTQAGSDASAGDPVKVGMRSSTLTSGVYNQRSITGSLSLVVSSGSTLGQTSAKQARIYFYLIDNAGTLELGVSQLLFSENGVITTTAEGGAGAADSGIIMYSTTARSNVPYRYIGYLDNTQSTAGTWASAGTVLGVGGYGSIVHEPQYVRYNTSAGDQLNTGVNSIINFGTKEVDDNNLVNVGVGAWSAAAGGNGTSNWEFIPKVSGVYKFEATFSFNIFTADTGYMGIDWLVAGSSKKTLNIGFNRYPGGNTSSIPTTFTYRLLAGQKVQFQLVQTNGTVNLTTGATYCTMEIAKIANY